jgi:sugar phosphate isomerase/epimerase
MEVKFFAPRWGSEQMPWQEFVGKVVANTYNGIEVYPLESLHEKQDLLKNVEDSGLELIVMHSQPDGRNFDLYIQRLRENLYVLADYQTNSLKPKFINSHTGREYYTQDQMLECFAVCDQFTADTGLKVLHETHRNKGLYAAHVADRYLKEYPALRLTLDISHWVCVSESFLEDQKATTDLALAHTDHLHARIGNTQGPQVSDPRAPEHQETVRHFLQWWDQWIKIKQDSGASECTITTEFGPHPYMNYKAFTTEPVADQWGINVYMKELLKSRY